MTYQVTPISNIELLGAFGIDDMLQYVKVSPQLELLPVITENRVDALKKDLPTLATGYNEALMIKNYDDYMKVKSDHFFRWIVNEGGWPLTNPPDFIGTNGAFAEVLATPYSASGWTGYATLYKGTIHFNCITLTKSATRVTRVIEFCGETFKRLVQGVDTRSAREKVFVVQQTSFGQSKLMLLTEIPGRKSCTVGGPASFVDVKQVTAHYSTLNYTNRNVRWWARAVLGNMDEMIVGRRGGNNRLVKVEVLNMQHLLSTSGHRWDPDTCYGFLQYVLSFLKNTVTIDDPRVTYVLRKEPGGDYNLNVQRIDRAGQIELVPKWFVELSGQKAKDGSNSEQL